MAEQKQIQEEEAEAEEFQFSFSSGETGSSGPGAGSGAVQGAAPVAPGRYAATGGTLFVNHVPTGLTR